jgi:hypothetical protein
MEFEAFVGDDNLDCMDKNQRTRSPRKPVHGKTTERRENNDRHIEYIIYIVQVDVKEKGRATHPVSWIIFASRPVQPH